MNGRMLSRAIHRTSPATMDAAMRTATRGESGANRRSPGPAVGSMNGGGGRPSTHRARAVEGPSATEGAGSSMVPQTTRRGTTVRPRDQARRRAARSGPRRSVAGSPAKGRWPLPDSAGGSSSPATRPHPSSPGASWATHGTRRSRRPGCRSIDHAGRNRPAIAFGAPVPARMALEGELADLVLSAMLPTWAVRESLIRCAPSGWRLIGLFDVWLGTPALAGQVAAADYRIELDGVDAAGAEDAIRSVLAASSLPRERQKGGTSVAYDLRPLLAGLAVVDPGPPVVVRARTRFDPVLGNGRPEEVIAALGEAAGATVAVRSIVRERLLMRDDPA